MTSQTRDAPDTVARLIAELNAIATDPNQEVRTGDLLRELRPHTNGQWSRMLRKLRPDLARPDAWARRCMKGSEENGLPSQPAAPPLAADSRSLGADTTALDARAMQLFPRLRPLLALPGLERSAQIIALAAEIGSSRTTIYRLLRGIRENGARALNRKPRSDAGQVRVPPEAQQAFVGRRLDPMTRHERVSVSIARVREQFPDLYLSEHSLRRIERSLPKALQMRNAEWRARFMPQGQWEVPHPNHTHTFDMTIADLWVWDGNPNEEPYRPQLTALVDEATQSCMYAIYTKETPNRAIVQALLIHAWLPKFVDDLPDSRWPMCGAPLHLHCDNGKVQDSDWLKAVCQSLGTDLDLARDIRHAQVRSPWQQGHVERFFGIVHERYESQLGAAYCGNDPQRKPESFADPSRGIHVWRRYPTLESLNVGFQTWLRTEFHQLRHRRLGTSRLEAWVRDVPKPVRIPDPDYLYQALLQRGRRKVVRGRIQWETMSYWHPLLQGYDGIHLEVRWDPADLTKLLVMQPDGRKQLCWAERQDARSVDNPKDWAELRAQRQQTKQARKDLEAAVGLVSSLDEREFAELRRRMETARRSTGIISFRVEQRIEKPDESGDEPSADELLELTERKREPELIEPLTVFGIEI